ncbi:solute carrier family 22 member 1-like isoform X2 [Aricia agestis]|uniref:solute carrier family 22 member 1-like isoform X2 n=1 Tax=Aricia agestis TaxID=91739 RepID=UPI001C20A3D6|nr:solute carrier family 22 member 1-like isoform X2 [Aricia agestis]
MTRDQKTIDLDDILDGFGNFQPYHLWLGFLINFGAVTNSIYTGNYVLVVENVAYRCADGNSSVCGGCDKWVYDNPDSFVAEFELACQDWKRTLVGTAHSTGYMFGLLLVGPLSDRFGRKTLIIATGVMGGVIGMLRSLSPWYWLYIALEFLEAAIGDSCLPAFVLMLEFVSKQKRVAFSSICTIGYPAGSMLFALAAWMVPYWRHLLLVLYTPALLFIFYIFFLDESPRWLQIKDRKKEATDLLVKISKINGKELDRHVLEKVSMEAESKVPLGKLLKNTFQSSALRKRFLVCLVWWISCTFVSYGMTINSVSLQGNKYVNYALISVCELFAIWGIMYVLTHYRRKFPLLLTFYIGAIFCLVQPFMPSNLGWLSVALYISGKTMSSFYFNITYIYTSELFPTYTRNSMHALCSSLGRIGSILAPQTPLLMPYWSGLPSIIFGVVAAVAGTATFLVPDIDSTSLPDTVHQAEAIGMKDKKTDVISRL